MATSLSDSLIWHDLYGDAEVAQLFTDSAELRAMLLVEGALATAQGKLGLIPEVSAAAIARAAREVLIDPAGLSAGAARDGVVVPALVTAFRTAMQAPEHGAYVHWGATSQDIQDTGLVLRLRRALDLMDSCLRSIITALAGSAGAHRDRVIVARTRWQAATPTTLGARIAVWGMPLVRHLERLDELRGRLLLLSLAGASGNLSAMAGRGQEVAHLMAQELGLGYEPVPWHAARDGIAELAGCLALINGSLGKMGGDLLGSAMAGDGVGAGSGGASSTMPHKQNPTGAEALGALVRQNLGLAAQVQAAAVHGFERDGLAWGQEMLALPGLVIGSAAALRTGLDLAHSLEVDEDRLTKVMDATHGMIFAEAASFALACEIGLPAARETMKAACREAMARNCHLRVVLEETAPGVDWNGVFDGASATGDAAAVVDGFLAAVDGVASTS